MPAPVREAHVDQTEPLHKFGQFHPKAAVIHRTALELLALLAAADDAGPLRARVGPLAVPFALAVRVAYAQQLHLIPRHLGDFAGIHDAVSMVGRQSDLFQVCPAASCTPHGTAESLVSVQEESLAGGNG